MRFFLPALASYVCRTSRRQVSNGVHATPPVSWSKPATSLRQRAAGVHLVRGYGRILSEISWPVVRLAGKANRKVAGGSLFIARLLAKRSRVRLFVREKALPGRES